MDNKTPTPPPSLYEDYLTRKYNINSIKIAFDDDESGSTVAPVSKPESMTTNSTYEKLNDRCLNNFSNLVTQKKHSTSLNEITLPNGSEDLKKYDYLSLDSTTLIGFDSEKKCQTAFFKNNIPKVLNYSNCLSDESMNQTLTEQNFVICDQDEDNTLMNSRIVEDIETNIDDFKHPANSTTIEESEDNNDSFEFHEMQSMINDNDENSLIKQTRKLSIVPEEESTTASGTSKFLHLFEHHLQDSNLLFSNTQNKFKSQEVDNNISVLKTNIKKITKENITLINEFQIDILNELSIKVNETLKNITEKHCLFNNDDVLKELKNVLSLKSNILKSGHGKHYKGCLMILKSLKSLLASQMREELYTSLKDKTNTMYVDNDKLVEVFQEETENDFKNKVLILNENNFKLMDSMLKSVNKEVEDTIIPKRELFVKQIQSKEKQCLSNLKFIENDLNEGFIKNVNSLKNLNIKFNLIESEIVSLSEINNEFIDEYKKHVLLEFQSKLSFICQNIIEQQTKDILNTFKITLHEKLNELLPKLNHQTEQWLLLKDDLVKLLDELSKPELSSPPKVQSASKMYSELRSQYKLALKTPDIHQRKLRKVFKSQSGVLTPGTMSSKVSEQVRNIFDS
uniref:Uncharacterized protein n=1 Tax=Clastoptera arizonana TaxID=38151 RepID=A0A1B6E379_9HEMI